MHIALTGGTGFVGGALIDIALHKGHSVTALARNPASLRSHDRLTIIQGDLADAASLAATTSGADAFLHLAGVTNARDKADYWSVNVDGAVQAAIAAKDAGARFVHASSLSARRPEVSPYAASKRDSESAVAAAIGDTPFVALRLPAIYGPGDLGTLPFFKLVKSGLAPAPRTEPPARASLVYVNDAAEALLAAASDPLASGVYDVDDARTDGHSWGELGDALAAELGVKARPIRVPKPLIAAIHGFSRRFASIRGVRADVREGQVNEFFHPDWVARDNLFSEASSWRATTTLKEGFAKTVHWYQKQGLL